METLKTYDITISTSQKGSSPQDALERFLGSVDDSLDRGDEIPAEVEIDSDTTFESWAVGRNRFMVCMEGFEAFVVGTKNRILVSVRKGSDSVLVTQRGPKHALIEGEIHAVEISIVTQSNGKEWFGAHVYNLHGKSLSSLHQTVAMAYDSNTFDPSEFIGLKPKRVVLDGTEK
jgi:hypothetical protein